MRLAACIVVIVGLGAGMRYLREARWAKRDIVADLEKTLGIRFDAFNSVLNLRAEGKLPADFSAVLLFEKYMKEIDALVTFVDQLDK